MGDEPLKDWEHSPVPAKDRQPFYRVAAVWINFVFVPVFINFAFDLGSRMTYSGFLASIFIGGSILAICSIATGVIGQRTGLSAGLLVSRVFGSSGGKVAALIPPLALIGWDSFSLDLVGSVTASVLGREDLRWLAIIVFMLLFSITATLGFRVMVRASIVTIPIMSALLLYALVLAYYRAHGVIAVSPPQETESYSSAVTKVVGLFALGATICSPDIQRFSRTATDAALVGITTFIGALPFLLIVGGTTALFLNNASLMGSFSALGLVLIGYVTFLLLSWSSIDNDYYSAALGVAAVTGLKKALLVLPIASVAAIIAIIGVTKYLEPWLILMSSLAIPLAGVFVAEGVRDSVSAGNSNKRWRFESFISWAIGSAVCYYSTRIDFGVPPLQGIIVAFGLQILWAKLLSKVPYRSDSAIE